MIKVHNIRLGMACNSSSTHSGVLLLPNEDIPKDYLVKDGYFGWEPFIAATEGAKRDYLSHIISDSLLQVTSKEIAEIVTAAWGGLPRRGDEHDGYIDHASMFWLPVTRDGKGLNEEFLTYFREFFLREDFVMCGGNDNDEDDGSRGLQGSDVNFYPLCSSQNNIARHDSTYDFWTIFNLKTGNKVRISLGNPELVVTRSSAPELIDFKITDKCMSNCPFCYMGSTPEGEHASMSDIEGWVSLFRQMELFEVALGGGEPTQHPKFVEIVEILRRYGITPNFSTKSLDWLKDHQKRPRIIEAIGAFAFSVTSARDIEELDALLVEYGVNRSKVTLQYVMGTHALSKFQLISGTPSQSFRNIVEVANNRGLSLTLLGYKTTGRGGSYTPHDYNGWIDEVKAVASTVGYIRINIDTTLAAQFKDELEAEGMPQGLMFHTIEGTYSMYVDAVEKKIGRSSFATDMEPFSLPNYPRDRDLTRFLTEYRKF